MMDYVTNEKRGVIGSWISMVWYGMVRNGMG